MIANTLLEQEFVGRRKELALFRKLLIGEIPEILLVFYGVGGVGKSWLVNKCMAQVEIESVAVKASINFSLAKDIDYLYVLTSLRNQLGVQYFPELNAALDMYAQRMRTIYFPFLQADSFSNISVNLHNNVFSGNVGDIAGIKLENVDIVIPKEELNRLRREMEEHTTSQFFKGLNRIADTEKVILFFDAYEQIEDVESAHVTNLALWLKNYFLKPLCILESKPVNVVIARRRTLTWDRENREWRQWIRHVELQTFTEQETNLYCQRRRIGVDDPLVANSVYLFTEGHPQCVSLACDLIQDIETSGEVISPDVFVSHRGDFNEKLVSEFLMEGILNRLPRHLYEVIYCCAVTHKFDVETIRTFLPNDPDPQGSLDKIKRYSFVYPEVNGGYTYHEVIHQLLLVKWKREDPDRFKILHKKALLLFKQKRRLEGDQRQLQLEFLYHQAHVSEPKALQTLAHLFTSAERYADISFCEKLIDVMNEVDLSKKASLMWLAYYQGRLFFLKGNWSLAEDLLLKVVSEVDKNLQLWAAAATTLGSLYQGLGRLDDAIFWLRRSLEVRKQLGTATDIISSLNELATAYRTKIEFEEALRCYQLSLEIATKENLESFSYETAYALLYSGVIYTGQGKYEEALKSYNGALGKYQQLKNNYGIARVQQRLGWMERIRGRLDDAVTHTLKAMQGMEELNMPFPLAELIHSLGNIYREQRKLDLALSHYERAIKMFQELDATRHIGIVLNDLGTLFQYQGIEGNQPNLLKKALEHFHESLSIKRSLNQRRETSVNLYLIGELNMLLGNWNDAERYLQESLDISREIKVRINETRSLTGLCELYFAIDDIENMQKYGQLAVSIAEADKYNHYAARVYLVYGNNDLKKFEFASAANNYALSILSAHQYNQVHYEQILEKVKEQLSNRLAKSQAQEVKGLILSSLDQLCPEDTIHDITKGVMVMFSK